MEAENAENEPPAVGTHPETSGKGFRVKNVSEINATSLNDAAENSNKRKFSAQTAESETKSKKPNNDNEITTSTLTIQKNEQIKENNEESLVIKTETNSSETIMEAPTQQTEAETMKVKVEPGESCNNEPSCSNVNGTSIETKIKVETVLVSSTTRESCRFGIRCYRQDNAHRQAEAHPGDTDYRRPIFPAPPPYTPACPYGITCYRRNPAHFQEYSHAEDNLYVPNIPRNSATQHNHLNRLAAPQEYEDETSDFDDDFEEPFSDDGDEYVPTDDDNYTDELSGDYDDCDRVEE